MRIYKKIFLFIFLFLIILFAKNNVFASTITYNNWEGVPQYATIEPLNLPSGTNSYITAINNDRNEVVVLVPYNPEDYIALSTTTTLENGTLNRLSGYNSSSKTLTDIKIYTSTFSTDTDSWSSWSSSVNSSVSAYAPGNNNYIYKSKFNVVLYANYYGIIENNIISSGIALPDGISLTDNISIISRLKSYSAVLFYSNIEDSYFSIKGDYIYCYSPSGSSIYYDYYKYDSATNSFVSQGSVDKLFMASNSRTVHYSTNNFSNNSLIYGSSNFFDFYYQGEYVFPYIADTDEVLQHIDEYDYTLIMPGSLIKNNLPLKFFIAEIVDDTQGKSVFEISLDTLSPYYKVASNNSDEFWFEVPVSLFKDYLVTDTDYLFSLIGTSIYDDFNITRRINYQGTTFSPPTQEEIQTDAIKNQTQKIEEQTEVIKEQTEVNKSIFARIGEILSYINPLSENFFAYKLVGILVDALKSLFIPEERISRYIFRRTF